MRITIDSAVDYLLAIPAHRSANQAHQELGKVALEELREYRELGTDETEKAYNKAVIAAVLSAARAFSVERDRIAGIWRGIDDIRTRHLRILAASRSLSPLAEKNYWTRAVALISAAGLSLEANQIADTSGQQVEGLVNILGKVTPAFAAWLIAALVLLEILSHVIEWIVGNAIERNGPIHKQKKWQELTMGRYEEFMRKYILEHISLHQSYFPGEPDIADQGIQSAEDISSLLDTLTNRHLYYKKPENIGDQ